MSVTGSRWPISEEAFHIVAALTLGLRLEKRGRRWALLPKHDLPGQRYTSWQRIAHVRELLDAKYIQCESSGATLTRKGWKAIRQENKILRKLWLDELSSHLSFDGLLISSEGE